MSRIFVTGMGVISAIGHSVAQNRQHLVSGTCGIQRALDLFPTKYAGLLPFGQVRTSTETLVKQLQVTDPGVTRTSLLALHAFNEMLEDAQLSPEDLASP
ncbi:MAG TPA: beta-ketoacyl synthase N-terminal-like domain-containing protein, partial [Ferruginibacter sp.]|nr:beta-ketoacyl synthase N-terminal-like domain-containing protein [Ferruginibacter sp.]